MSKVTKKTSKASTHVKIPVDPMECPFREFRDHELSSEYWGMGPAAFRSVALIPKMATKPGGGSAASSAYHVWVDDQSQPLPKSIRQYLDGWVRAEDLAMSRFECDVVVFEENINKMSVIDYQLSHAQVLLRSSFCRQVLSACFILERVESLQVEHQWESFNFVFGPEGWRAKCHIYSPGMKAGGGVQHKPNLSKNGCYLIRLYYLGAWRCVWVSDQVPVDASGAPLLPFSPLSSPSQAKGKGIPTTVTSHLVHLWPLLLCKALLKIAAPDMNADEDREDEQVEDEVMSEFDIMHSLTGGLSLIFQTQGKIDYDLLWKLLSTEVHNFTWDDDDDMQSSTVKSKSTKKPNPKDKDNTIKRGALVSVTIADTKDYEPYTLPGITPAHEMSLIVSTVRDVPLKKPLPEPEIPLWKNYRWVDWARRHGLYEAYECPRTKFLKVNGLMKLSYAPHLLDIQSTESITHCFREEQTKEAGEKIKKIKDASRPSAGMLAYVAMKEELREWVQFDAIQPLILKINAVYYPSLFKFTSATSSPPIRITKALRNFDVQAPKSAPLYLQIDGPEENFLKLALNMLHPRILMNSGSPVEDYIEKAYVILECFEWFLDKKLPLAKAFIATRGYDSVEVSFPPGRHYCRLWVHSHMNWHVSILSESSIILGTRDVIQAAAIHECPWASKFLNYLGASFTNWIRIGRSVVNINVTDRDFYSSYQPDLVWDPKVTGYDETFVHWMFRQALQGHLYKRLIPQDYASVCNILRRYFCDPDFGFPPKPKPSVTLREIVDRDPCDCVMPENEAMEEEENFEEMDREQETEESKRPLVSPETMEELLKEPQPPVVSQVCELATEEVPCGVLKDEREKVIRKHEAATCIQAFWRGAWARKCLTSHVVLTADVMKLLMENAFGNLEMLSALMNEFFLMFPGAKYAYSVSSALSGVYGLNQHTGVSPVTTKCKWIPYFQGVFYCHMNVKVHFDVHSTIPHSTLQVYDNDTGEQMPQTYNAHVTFDFSPNVFGYTVMGHGTLNKPLGHYSEANWQLTVMTSIDNVFHVCDNHETELCNILPLTSASKLHIDEMYIPNRRNILGGIQISVTRVEAVSFRAAATTPDLEIVAILRTFCHETDIEEEVDRCHGKGEIFWPYIRLKPAMSNELLKKRSYSTGMLQGGLSQGYLSARSLKGTIPKVSKLQSRLRSATKVHALRSAPQEPKTYTLEVIAAEGWALPLQQWKRVDEVRNDVEIPKYDTPSKPKSAKDKTGSAKEKKEKDDKAKSEADKPPIFNITDPLPEDAYVELECSTTVGGGAIAKRDDDRDILFATVRRSWDMKDPGRNARGAYIRAQFREEFLVPLPPPKTESAGDQTSVTEELLEEIEGEVTIAKHQGPTPATESGLLEMMAETEEESLYYVMPEQLRDKFVPLYFVPLCTKEKCEEESAILTDDMAEAAKNERNAHLEAALERMRELQHYNEIHVLGRQRKRCQLLEALGVDGTWNPDLATVLEERDEAIARESLERQVSAAKKKQDAKQGKK